MTPDYLTLTGALLAGIASGGAFFAALLWTVRRSVSVKQPAAWMFGSLVLRTAGVLTVFYVVGGGDWRRWVACLTGFIVARTGVILLVRSRGCEIGAPRGVSDAPES